MRIGTFFYCLKQGLRNTGRNIWFSLASAATIAACIFIFCVFFSVIANIYYMVRQAESTVGITVLFDETYTEEEIREVGQIIAADERVMDLSFTSADEAWESFKQEYFEGREELAEGFADDNPLAGSASYTVFLNSIEDQPVFVAWLYTLDGVRQVNFSNAAAAGFSSFNRVLSLLSLGIIGVLLAVSVFLISNTISVAAAFRRQESEIMRMIGATNFMIRAPFIVEGVLLGLAGAAIPLVGIYFLYTKGVAYITENFRILSDAFYFMPIGEIYPFMAAVALALGLGIGFIGSFFTIRRYLRV